MITEYTKSEIRHYRLATTFKKMPLFVVSNEYFIHKQENGVYT
jgi:hypothetical protein